MIRTGVVLPTFRDTPEDALEAARQAVAAGVDGVFCYDHIWPYVAARSALPWPRSLLLAALLAQFESPLTQPVTGQGLPGDVGSPGRAGAQRRMLLESVHRARRTWLQGRVMAGLGTGDRLSEAENRAYGIPFAPAARAARADMVELARSAAGGSISRSGWPVVPGRADRVAPKNPASGTR